MKVLTVRQPWAWLLVHGFKDVENRSRRARHRGILLIQAALHRAPGAYFENARKFAAGLGIVVPPPADLEYGGVIGAVNLDDCVSHSASPWYQPPAVAWIVSGARLLDFVPLRGRQGSLFDLPDELVARFEHLNKPALPNSSPSYHARRQDRPGQQ